MADVHIKGIKLLNKRYSTAEWTSGTTVNGETVIPKLAQGELGLNTNTLEVKIGTDSAAEQTWANAKLVSAGVKQATTYYYKDGTTGNSPKAEETYVCTSASVSNEEDGSHDFTVVFKEISLVNPATDVSPTLTVSSGTASTPTADTIDVVTGASTGGTKGHAITLSKSKAATKAYVDGKKLTITDTGTGDFITDITESNSAGGHTITVTRGSVDIDFPTITATKTGTGTFLTGVTVSGDDNHTLTFTSGNETSLSGGSAAAADASLVGGVTVSGHKVTVDKKTIKSGDSVIGVTGTASAITITADTYTKSQIDTKISDLRYEAMIFQGVINSSTDLPSTITKDMNGYTYKVGTAGTYASQAAKVGDLFIAHWDTTSSTGSYQYIPSADDEQTVDTWRPINVNSTQLKGNGIGTGAVNIKNGNAITVSGSGSDISISHNDTSTVENLTKAARTYVDGLTFDTYGHVTGYTVGTETDQTIPTGSGSIAEGSCQVVSSASLSSGHALSGTKKTLTAGTKMAISDASSKITITHSNTTRSNTTSTATPTHSGTFTAIDSITSDATGHVTAVNTKTITLPSIPDYKDTNTTYNITETTGTTTAGSTSVNVNLKGSDNTTDTFTIKADSATTTPTDGLSVSLSGDTITLTGKATESLLGMIRAAYALSTDDTSALDSKINTFSGTHNDKLYGVNVRKDGTAFVEVPWTDTHYTVSGAAARAQDLYAFSTDASGHVNGVATVTVLDGNLA